jgi:subtilisin family serine protease
VLALVLAITTPVSASNHNNRGNSNKDSRGTSTTTSIVPPETSGKSNGVGKSEAPGKSNGVALATTTTIASATGSNRSGKSDNAGKSDTTPAQPESTGKSDGAGSIEKGSANGEATKSSSSRAFIVRFVAGVRPEEAGKSLVATYNEDVKKINSAARAEAGTRAATPSLLERGSFVTSFEKVLNAAVIRVPAAAVAGLSRNPRVLSIEKDATITVDPSSVTQLNAPWGLDRIDQRALPLSGSFSSPSNGSGVNVYIVDTGIDASHREFGGRVASGFDAVSGSDGRTDCNGHGTHVAGTAGAATYGVAKSVRLVPVRVLGCDGSGTYSGVIAGLDWIAKNLSPGEKAVANMSLGGGASSSLDSAVASLVSAGVTVVVAAGNSNVDACNTSPARAASAITVGATTTSDARASYSNFGRCLDLFAPGSSVTSTVPGGGTATYSGTSMAAPHVAGVAAVVLSLRDLSPSALASYLVEVATTGVVSSAGTDSPNLLAYVPQESVTPTPEQPDPVATVPDQAGTPIAEARDKAAVVSWSIPDDGGSPITSQTVRTYSGGRLVASAIVDGVTSSTRITRLRNGTSYTFTVQARNAIGIGLESTQSNVIRPAR